MGYQAPNAPISSSWQDHKNRNPPSSEPGTDYATAYGTWLESGGSGVVSDKKTDNGGGTGRYVAIDTDDGHRIRYLHMSDIWVNVGQRVSRGDFLGTTGASGYGSDWYYGPHVHVTLFPGHYYDFDSTLDFQNYVGPEGDFLMGLSDAQQNEVYAWVKDTQNRVRGGDPNVDMLQDIQANVKETYVRVRGPEAGYDMLQDILSRTKNLETNVQTETHARKTWTVAILVLVTVVVGAIGTLAGFITTLL